MDLQTLELRQLKHVKAFTKISSESTLLTEFLTSFWHTSGIFDWDTSSSSTSLLSSSPSPPLQLFHPDISSTEHPTQPSAKDPRLAPPPEQDTAGDVLVPRLSSVKELPRGLPPEQQDVPADPAEQPVDETGEGPVKASGCTQAGGEPALLAFALLLASRMLRPHVRS